MTNEELHEESPMYAERLADKLRGLMEAEGIKLPKKKKKPKEDDPEVYFDDGKKVKRIRLDKKIKKGEQ
jgi:hypothetical protein